jgi:hypothetical protein
MKSFKLNLDDLSVDSFKTTTEDEAARGTVKGQEMTIFRECNESYDTVCNACPATDTCPTDETCVYKTLEEHVTCGFDTCGGDTYTAQNVPDCYLVGTWPV